MFIKWTQHKTMAFVRVVNALVLLQLLLVCSSIAVYGDEVNTPAEAPHPPHHPYPHPHPHPHPHQPPIKPPVYPPVTPPAHPPVKPPVYPPVKPPVHPPVKPPTHPPVKPPVTPPVKPPVHPPVKPPTHPPVKPPAHPPVKPPIKLPTPPPVKPPTLPPVKPPSYPPVNPPIYPPQMKLVAVQGIVFCKSCKYRGINNLMGAVPLAGAVVKLQCNDTKYGLVEQTKTNKNGYFFFNPQKLTTAAYRKCRVFLVSSPLSKCNVPTNLHDGITGAVLIPVTKPPVTSPKKKQPSMLFNVGPFAFEPHKKLKCHY